VLELGKDLFDGCRSGEYPRPTKDKSQSCGFRAPDRRRIAELRADFDACPMGQIYLGRPQTINHLSNSKKPMFSRLVELAADDHRWLRPPTARRSPLLLVIASTLVDEDPLSPGSEGDLSASGLTQFSRLMHSIG